MALKSGKKPTEYPKGIQLPTLWCEESDERM